MALPKHTRTSKGTFRRERADSLIKNLKKEYPALEGINGNKKLGTLRKEMKVESLDQVLRKVRAKNNS